MTINNRPILNSNNVVVDIIVIDDNIISNWPLPNNHIFGELGGLVGDTWNGTEYISPVSVVTLTTNHIEQERKKRIIDFLLLATGKTFTWEEASNIILEATREATTLLNIKVKRLISNTNPDWTAEQATRAASLESMSNTIDFINTKAAELKLIVPVPSDYKSNTYWTQ